MRPVLQLLDEHLPGRADVEAQRLGLLMLWLADDLIRIVNERLERFEISEKKLDVLMILAAQAELDEETIERDPDAMLQTPSGIADYVGVTRATVTGLLDWLEKRDLIARRGHPTDRRSMQIEITQAGKRLVAQAAPVFGDACTRLSSTLSERDRKDLSRILARLWSEVKRHPD
jgi:MarR family transcriptional regulator, negative regulator of the multidrug operon emrRAB